MMCSPPHAAQPGAGSGPVEVVEIPCLSLAQMEAQLLSRLARGSPKVSYAPSAACVSTWSSGALPLAGGSSAEEQGSTNADGEESSNSSDHHEDAQDSGSRGGPATVTEKATTTLMVRNIPIKYTQETLAKEWQQHQFAWDFLYLPRGSAGENNLSYAFVNFISEAHAEAFKRKWDRTRLSRYSARKALNISAAEVQGLSANLELLRKKRARHLRIGQCEPLIVLGAAAGGGGRRMGLDAALAALAGGATPPRMPTASPAPQSHAVGLPPGLVAPPRLVLSF